MVVPSARPWTRWTTRAEERPHGSRVTREARVADTLASPGAGLPGAGLPGAGLPGAGRHSAKRVALTVLVATRHASMSCGT